MLTIKNFSDLEDMGVNEWKISTTSTFDERYVCLIRSKRNKRLAHTIAIYRTPLIQPKAKFFINGTGVMSVYRIEWALTRNELYPKSMFDSKQKFLELVDNNINDLL
jgi:hypothetical protein